MTRLTHNQRRCLVELSEGDWSDLQHHAPQVRGWLTTRGLIRHCYDANTPRLYTITSEGLRALGVSA